MAARIYRGADRGALARDLLRLALAWGGALAALLAMGLVVRGALGWALVVTPLVALTAWLVTARGRVLVELADGQLRYEGASTRHDFEVPLEAICDRYFDAAVTGRPLVVVLADGDERALRGLRRARAEALARVLPARGTSAPPAP